MIAISYKMTLTFRLTLIFHKSVICSGVVILQGSDHTPPLSRVGGVADIRVALCKPLFFLDFDAFPRWIPQHYVKPTRPPGLLVLRLLVLRGYPEHIGEGQVPVEELVLLPQADDLGLHP